MLSSLDALAALPADTRVYCTHEYTESNLAFAAAVEPDNGDIRTYRKRCAEIRAQGQPTLPSTLGQEKRINPFLRVDEQSVQAAAAARGAAAGRVDVFAAIRAWKDEF